MGKYNSCSKPPTSKKIDYPRETMVKRRDGITYLRPWMFEMNRGWDHIPVVG
jgi:hypothetical protein